MGPLINQAGEKTPAFQGEFMLPSLYTIASQYKALTELDVESIDEQTLLDTLEGLEGDLTMKTTNVVAFQKNTQLYADMAKEAAKKLKERADALQRRADSIKAYLKMSMEAGGLTKLEGPEFVVSIQKNPPAVIIDDAGKIPTDLYVYPVAPDPYPNKTAIAAAIKAGQEVPGAHLEQGTRLAIK